MSALLHRLVLMSVCLFTQGPGGTVQTGTGKVDQARKFKCTTAARAVLIPSKLWLSIPIWFLNIIFLPFFINTFCRHKLFQWQSITQTTLRSLKIVKLWTKTRLISNGRNRMHLSRPGRLVRGKGGGCIKHVDVCILLNAITV